MRRAATFASEATALVALAATASSVFNSHGTSKGVLATCDPVLILSDSFDNVTPPALEPGWTATNAIDPDGIFWQTSDAGLPSPPADSLPNAVWVNDPSVVSDKYLDTPTFFIFEALPAQLSFRQNFNLQSGFDGGVL